MAEHINNICNLSKLDGEKVKFITTDNFGVTQSLKNTGDIVLLRDEDRHDIYVGGEHIAGGYGFDNDSALDKLTDVAVTYYDYLHHLNYIDENIITIKKLVDEYEDEQSEDVTPEQVEEHFVNIKNIRFSYSSSLNSSVISHTDEALIVKAGTTVNFTAVTFDADGDSDITYLDLFSKKYFDGLTVANKINREYTQHTISKQDYDIDPVVIDGNYVSGLSLQQNGKPTTYTDNVLIATKYYPMSQSGSRPLEFVSKPIYWQLPYLFGVDEITTANFNNYNGNTVYRDDYSVDTMINKEITIDFVDDYSYGYFACPRQWGEPNFTHKESGLTHYWEKITTNPIQCNVNGTTIDYDVYHTKIEYHGITSITWIISSK